MHRPGKVDPANRMTIGRAPCILARGGGDRAAIEGAGFRGAVLANVGLPALVTFW
jgi:hypothetical protein